MNSRSGLAIALLSTLMLGSAEAQIIQQQTVQLPTFHYFGVSTTVVVPTRGTIPLGSVTRAGSFRTPYDKYGSSFGRFSEVNQLSMGVTVIDHNEIDRALLAEAARRRGAKFDVLGRPVLGRPVESVDGDVYLRRGRDAELSGQPEVAQVFYRRAAKLGNAVAAERLAQLDIANKPK
jgi:hypothetical protein